MARKRGLSTTAAACQAGLFAAEASSRLSAARRLEVRRGLGWLPRHQPSSIAPVRLVVPEVCIQVDVEDGNVPDEVVVIGHRGLEMAREDPARSGRPARLLQTPLPFTARSEPTLWRLSARFLLTPVVGDEMEAFRADGHGRGVAGATPRHLTLNTRYHNHSLRTDI